MIDTIYLANTIENLLNENSLGKKFLIFADEGEMRKSQKKCGKAREYWVNGLVDIVGSNIVPIKNISFQTVTAQLMIIADLNLMGRQLEGKQDREQSRELADVKTCLYEMIGKLNGQVQQLELGDKTYTTTVVLSQPSVGAKMELGEISEGVPIYVNMTYSLFENGVNANDCHIYIDNEDLYFETATFSKVRQADQSEFANTNGARSYVLIGGKSIDLVLPAVNTDVGGKIMKDILGDTSNEAIAVRIETPLETKNFIGVFGNNTASMQLGANVGFNVSVVQGVENLLKYGENWKIERVSTESATKSVLGKKIIFWGDNTSDFIEDGGEVAHTYTDGVENHTIRIYGE